MSDHEDELRRRVAAAYEDVLDEPVPDRLVNLLAPPGVTDLAAERAKRRWRSAPATWVQWGGMAASLVVGVMLGLRFAPGSESLIATRDGHVVAESRLAHVLDSALASDPPGPIAVQLSFVDNRGRFCRTFAAGELAGLACRDDARWSVIATAQAAGDAGDASNGMRPAGTALPKPVLDAVDARIAGNALDAQHEREARDRGWRR